MIVTKKERIERQLINLFKDAGFVMADATYRIVKSKAGSYYLTDTGENGVSKVNVIGSISIRQYAIQISNKVTNSIIDIVNRLTKEKDSNGLRFEDYSERSSYFYVTGYYDWPII